MASKSIKIIHLEIWMETDGTSTPRINATMKHKCKSQDDALNIVQEFIDRKRNKKEDA